MHPGPGEYGSKAWSEIFLGRAFLLSAPRVESHTAMRVPACWHTLIGLLAERLFV
jgi:hypothetical protein